MIRVPLDSRWINYNSMKQASDIFGLPAIIGLGVHLITSLLNLNAVDSSECPIFALLDNPRLDIYLLQFFKSGH